MDGKDDKQKPTDQMQARKRMMDLIAHRDHSEHEIRNKLAEDHAPEHIDSAVEYGKAHGWVPNSIEAQAALSKKMGEFLHRKLKGIEFINNTLREKGLPPLDSDRDHELEKATALIQNKFSDEDLRDRKIQAKAIRFLASRGFEMEIVHDLIFKR